MQSRAKLPVTAAVCRDFKGLRFSHNTRPHQTLEHFFFFSFFQRLIGVCWVGAYFDPKQMDMKYRCRHLKTSFPNVVAVECKLEIRGRFHKCSDVLLVHGCCHVLCLDRKQMTSRAHGQFRIGQWVNCRKLLAKRRRVNQWPKMWWKKHA